MDGFREFIRDFSASWFALVMGTGVFANATYFFSQDYGLRLFEEISRFLVFLNFLLFFVILVPFLIKMLLFFPSVREDFKNPIKANFYVTFGIAMLTLATNFSLVEDVFPFYLLFWFAGTFAVIGIEMLIMIVAFLGEHIEIDHINPSWFLGATGLLLVPGSGSLLATLPEFRDAVLFLFDFTFGAGFFMYLAFFSIWIYRFILHRPLRGNRIPLFWINLGPIGAFLVSISTYYHDYFTLGNSAILFGLLFFGSGVWWLFMALIVTIHYVGSMDVEYRTAWWSFTFPVGQFLVGSYFLNSIISYRSIDLFLLFLYAILVVVWIINALMTLSYLVRGNIDVAQRMD